jgi:hypothetical protein
MVTSTITYPRVRREEHHRRLNETMARVGGMMNPAESPDPSRMLTGACKGVTCHLVDVTDEVVVLEIPPQGARVSVPLDDVEGVWKHDHRMLGMKLGVNLVVPANIFQERVRLESE